MKTAMRSFIRSSFFLMVLVMPVMMFAACGDEKNDPEPTDTKESVTETVTITDAAIIGKSETWGNITVFVPEDMTLNGGSLFDRESRDRLSLNARNGTAYYNISAVTMEQAERDIAATKAINASFDPEDIEFSIGATEWKGISYVSVNVDCFHICGTVNGRSVEILAGYNKYDSDKTKAILSSLAIADNEPAGSTGSGETAEAAESTGTFESAYAE